MNFYENLCFRCDQTVYQVDRVGPLKDFTFFHQGCFKCSACGTKLTLKTYYNNQDSNDDKEVYCVSHVPKIGPGHLDGSAVGIRSALNVPKSFNYVNEQIRGGGKGTFDAEALAIKPHLNNGRHGGENGSFAEHQYGRFDASALHIAHALRATELQRSYKRPIEKPLDSYLVSWILNLITHLVFPPFKCLSFCLNGQKRSRKIRYIPSLSGLSFGREHCGTRSVSLIPSYYYLTDH